MRQENLGYLNYGVYAHPDYLQRYGQPRHPSELRQHLWIDRLNDLEHGVTLSHPMEGDYPLPPSRFGEWHAPRNSPSPCFTLTVISRARS